MSVPAARPDAKQEIARLVEEYRLVSELLASLQAQYSVVEDTLEELAVALDGVRVLKSEGGGEKFVHIGAGIFVRGQFAVREVLVPIGARYYAFFDLETAEGVLRARIDEYTKVKAALEDNMKRLSERAAQLRQALEGSGVVIR
jgi:prefoldin alpha subunit